ncbi:phage shock protein C [Lysobacter enzymogenes]|jgi:phage shock protein C|uniref:Phage shock protein C, PspC n=2 Tax=Lysobacter enzymogenes TaxID=69 RepID=A0AAU9AIP2_LYSEN|nr:PspC domain-containing protein [Lysobacter enzymogenes]BAV97663.1 phage shock protein C, PspC [Lysobacter enzymogenes]
MSSATRTLCRSRHDRMIAGVCGGLALRLRWNPVLVRAGFVVLALATFVLPVALAYLVLWLLMPEEGCG